MGDLTPESWYRAFVYMNPVVTASLVALVEVAAVRGAQRPSGGVLATIDHLVYAAPSLQEGVEGIERLLGVRASPGGQHLGRGTRNALLALGPDTYLEIIAPDPEQPRPAEPRWFGIDALQEPRLVTWAAKGTSLDQLFLDAEVRGVRLGAVTSSSRTQSNGVRLTWLYTDPRTVVADGVVPFFIDWGPTQHPSRSAPRGASLLDLRAEHPNPEYARQTLSRLGLDLEVREGPRAALIARISGLRGVVELR